MFTNEMLKQEAIKNLRRRTNRLEREGEYWTDDEKKKLRDLFDEGVGLSDISLVLQRSERAVIQQVQKQDLYNSKEQPQRAHRGFKPPMCLCNACQLERNACPRCIHEQNSKEAE